jgi:hypothetical protein
MPGSWTVALQWSFSLTEHLELLEWLNLIAVASLRWQSASNSRPAFDQNSPLFYDLVGKAS